MYSLRSKLVLAVCAALAGTAYAGQVTLGGSADVGLTISHTKDGTSYKETAGNYVGSEVIVKGEETFGNMNAGFNLTSGFDLNTGGFDSEPSRLFNHESQVYLGGQWGRFGLGRISPFSSSLGSNGWFAEYDAFEGGFDDAGLQATQQNYWGRYSNSAYYVSPEVSGVQVGMFYSLSGSKTDEQADRFKDNERYWNAALRWNGDKAGVILSGEGTQSPQASALKNGYVVKVSGKYDFGPLKLMGGYSHAEHQDSYAFATWKANDDYQTDNLVTKREGIRSDAAYVGVQIPYGYTQFNLQYQFLDGKNKDTDQKFQRHVVAAGAYHYISPRTMFYGVGSYSHGSGALSSKNDIYTNAVNFHVGMSHFF